MNKKAKDFIFAGFIRKAVLKAHAANQITSATTSENGGVKLTDAIRMVYSREIEFKALPVMRFAQFATEKT